MESSVYTQKLRKILGKGEGIKVALFDERARSVLSNVVPHSLFLEHGYFLLEMLGSRRCRMGRVTCSVFAGPESIGLLASELRSPCYESYFVYLLNSVSDEELSAIAAADRMCVVREIYEIYVDTHQLDTSLFALEPRACPQRYAEGWPDACDARRICSLLKTLGLRPAIQTHANTEGLAQAIHDAMDGFRGACARMLVLDRSVDLVTPLLYEWRYQPMVYEYLSYEGGLARMFKRTFSLFNDSFFDENKFHEISRVSEALHRHTSRMHGKRPGAGALVDDSSTVETHLNIHNFILKECVKNADVSNAEYACVAGTHASCGAMLASRDIPHEKRAKLFLVHLHATDYEFSTPKEEMLRHKALQQHPEFMEAVDRYSAHARMWPGKRYKCRFVPDLDLKLAYQPALSRITRRFIGRRLWGLRSLGEDAGSAKSIVIYVRGGLTYSEYRGILSEARDASVYVVTDYMIGYKDIMADVLPEL